MARPSAGHSPVRCVIKARAPRSAPIDFAAIQVRERADLSGIELTASACRAHGRPPRSARPNRIIDRRANVSCWHGLFLLMVAVCASALFLAAPRPGRLLSNCCA